MLRNQAKKQSSFYACASCRRQHQHDLAQLRSISHIRTAPLSSISQPSSSSSATLSKRPNLQGPRNWTTYHGVLSRTIREDAKGYADWGKFGSQSVPGRTPSAWGASLKNDQRTPSPSLAWGGGGTNIPPATGTSAWGGHGRTPSGSAMPAWAAGANNTPNVNSTSTPNPPGAVPSPQAPIVGAQNGDFQRSTEPAQRTREGQPSRSRPDEAASYSSSVATSSSTVPGAGTIYGTSKGSTLQTPIPAKVPGAVNAVSSSSASVSGQPPNTPWNKNALGAFPPGGVSGTPAPGGLANWIPGQPTFGGASAWTPRKTTSSPSSVPTEDASADSGTTSANLTSGFDASNWKQKSTRGPASAPEKLPAQTTRNSASPSSSGSRTADPILDTVFTRLPTRKPSPGVEFPQLRRRSSRDDMFESMSPFKLPSRQNRRGNKIPPPGSAQNAITQKPPSQAPDQQHRRDSQLPREGRNPDRGTYTRSRYSAQVGGPSTEAADARSSNSPKPSNFEDQFELMKKAVDTTGKTRVGFDQSDWGDGPIPTGSSQRTRPTTDRDTAPPEGTRRGKYSEGGVDSSGRGGGPDREPRNYKGRGRDATPLPGVDDYTVRDKAKRRKKFGGDRRQNIDEDEGFEDFDEYQEARAIRRQRQRRLEEKRAAREAAAPKTIRLPEYITVYDLAEALRIRPAHFLRDLEQLGFENTLHDSVMTGETAALVAAEYGFEPTVESGVNVDLRPRPPPEDPTSVPPRPPIVTIMGHVDHGKTTILDTLRKSSIVAQEFGGITQHIGAFSVKLSTGKTITFLDTPGHAAFLSMRQRGANVTDIVVLVVAVDDSVKPQTIEAIKHAQSAKVPMIVAINKIDVDNTPNRLDMVKQDLANNGVEIEDYGGDVQTVAISGRTGQGIRDLEDAILTLSEVLDMRAEIDGMAEGWVLEASIKSDGRAATILVKRGTLRIGDLIVAGTAYTRVRIMRNEAGVDVEEAGPGTPIEIYGSWKGEPMSGDMVLQAPDEPKAQAAVDYRQEIAERAIAAAQNAEREAQDREKAEREALKIKTQEAEKAGDPEEEAEPVEVGPKVVSIIIKGDVMGSVEAVSMAIQEIGNNEVRPRILRSSPGQITESDVDHMATAKGAIVNFNSTIPGHILLRANQAGVVILDHNIIYETVQAVKDLLAAQLPPIYTQRVLAEAQVAQVFPINIKRRKYQNIAGVKVTNGKVTRGGQYRVMRDGEQVYNGKLAALKQNKDDVTEIRKGTECGMMFEGYDEFQVGDLIQLYEDVEQKRYL